MFARPARRREPMEDTSAASLTGTFSGIRSAAEDTAGASERVAREAADLAEGAGEVRSLVERFRVEAKESSAAGLKVLRK